MLAHVRQAIVLVLVRLLAQHMQPKTLKPIQIRELHPHPATGLIQRRHKAEAQGRRRFFACLAHASASRKRFIDNEVA